MSPRRSSRPGKAVALLRERLGPPEPAARKLSATLAVGLVIGPITRMAVEFKDYYRILGVDRNADDKALKSAYRKLARKHHPDVSKGAGAADKFKEINEAYEVLSDPEKRRRYDSLGPDWQRYAQGPAGQPGGGSPGGFHVEYGNAEDPGGFSAFFRTIFGELGARTREGRGGRQTVDFEGLEDLLGRGA